MTCEEQCCFYHPTKRATYYVNLAAMPDNDLPICETCKERIENSENTGLSFGNKIRPIDEGENDDIQGESEEGQADTERLDSG